MTDKPAENTLDAVPSYDALIEHNPKIAQVINEKIYDFSGKVNDKTVDVLGDLWHRHFKKNLSLFYKKHGLVNDGCHGFGHNKAVIGIGAGPSFSRNKEYLKRICHYNSKFPFNQQPFLFIVSNHQFKPCVNEGIVPHFVALADASESDAIKSQLCDDVPERAHHTILLCSLNANPHLLKEWDKQGKLIQFYVPPGEWNKKTFKEKTGFDAEKKQLMQGGNVMNVSWVASWAALGSRIFITVGNDLGYEPEKDEEKRRQNYYADGDYSTNLASNRDEAKKQFAWMGYSIDPTVIVDEKMLTFKPYSTVSSLFNYKAWIETMIGIQDASGQSFHYYNCSEAGILGVLAKSYEVDDMTDMDNWILMDEIFPNHWHTTTFEAAVTRYLSTRELWLETRMATGHGAGLVTGLPGKTAGVSNIVLPGKQP